MKRFYILLLFNLMILLFPLEVFTNTIKYNLERRDGRPLVDRGHPYLNDIYVEKEIDQNTSLLFIKYTRVLVLKNNKEVRQEFFIFNGDSKGNPDEIKFLYIGKNTDIALLYPKEYTDDPVLTERIHQFTDDKIFVYIHKIDKDYVSTIINISQNRQEADIYSTFFLETFFYNDRTALYLKKLRERKFNEVIGKSILVALYGDKLRYLKMIITDIKEEKLETANGIFSAFRIDYNFDLNLLQRIGIFFLSMPKKMTIWIQTDKDIILKYHDEKYNYIYAGEVERK